MPSGPADRYYRSLVGAWSGAFVFEVIDGDALRRAGVARLRLRAMSLAGRVVGPSTMSTTLSAVDGDQRAFVHTTRVEKWGVVAFESEERIEIDDGGATFQMTGEQRSWPGRPETYVASGEIDADARHATYRIPWLGVDVVQRTAVQNDGALELVQETTFSRARVLLRRSSDGPVRAGRAPVSNRVPLFVFVAVLSGAGGYALLRGHGDPPRAAAPVADPPRVAQEAPPQLPPNHPPIGSTDPHANVARVAPSPDDRPAITWKMPADWASVDNPSRMRLATFRPKRAAGDTEDADLSVSRAGGTTDANIHRWVGQFDGAGPDQRTEKTVRGLKVSIVEVEGTYIGGMMGGGGQAEKHPRWALLGAIVETNGAPYFFKMVGPAATVRASRTAFLSMLDGLEPTKH